MSHRTTRNDIESFAETREAAYQHLVGIPRESGENHTLPSFSRNCILYDSFFMYEWGEGDNDTAVYIDDQQLTFKKEKEAEGTKTYLRATEGVKGSLFQLAKDGISALKMQREATFSITRTDDEGNKRIESHTSNSSRAVALIRRVVMKQFPDPDPQWGAKRYDG